MELLFRNLHFYYIFKCQMERSNMGKWKCTWFKLERPSTKRYYHHTYRRVCCKWMQMKICLQVFLVRQQNISISSMESPRKLVHIKLEQSRRKELQILWWILLKCEIELITFFTNHQTEKKENFFACKIYYKACLKNKISNKKIKKKN